MLAFEVSGGKAAAFRLANALTIIGISNDLGDAKSLVTHPETTTHQRLKPEQRAALGIAPAFEAVGRPRGRRRPDRGTCGQALDKAVATAAHAAESTIAAPSTTAPLPPLAEGSERAPGSGYCSRSAAASASGRSASGD